MFEMKKCAKECYARQRSCKEEGCRLWIDHDEDLNCSLVSIEKNGPMTLHQVAERMKISYVRVKQLQDLAIKKIDKEELRDELFVLDDGFF